MKKFIFAGLLASIFAAVLVFTGCASSPQTDSPQAGNSQKKVTITGISSEFNEKYATLGLRDNNTAVAASLPGQISGGSVTVELLDAAAGNPPFTKNGNYSVILMISNTNNISIDNFIWLGGTTTNITSTTTTIPFSNLRQVNQ